MNLNFFACLLIVAGIRETSFRIFQLITILRKEETLEIKKNNNKSFLKKESTISNILKRSMLFNSIAATTPTPSPLLPSPEKIVQEFIRVEFKTQLFQSGQS